MIALYKIFWNVTKVLHPVVYKTMLSQLLVMEWNVTYPQTLDLLRSKEEQDIVVWKTINSCQYVKQIKILSIIHVFMTIYLSEH